MLRNSGHGFRPLEIPIPALFSQSNPSADSLELGDKFVSMEILNNFPSD